MNYFQPTDRKEWRHWLRKNHKIEHEVWLVYYKKHTNKETVTYAESVEEAICFGWIDGIKKRIDDEKYTHRFTIRKDKSRWSTINIATAKKMIKERKMTAFGLAVFNKRMEYDQPSVSASILTGISLKPELESKLKSNKTAWDNLMSLTPGHRKQYILWLNNAKKEATMLKRLSEVISKLEKNQKLGLK